MDGPSGAVHASAAPLLRVLRKGVRSGCCAAERCSSLCRPAPFCGASVDSAMLLQVWGWRWACSKASPASPLCAPCADVALVCAGGMRCDVLLAARCPACTRSGSMVVGSVLEPAGWSEQV